MESTNYIQKIVDKKFDDIVHRKFIRFSIGDYPREKIIIKKQSKNLQIQTGFELAIDIYLLAADLLAKEDVVIEGKGVVFSTTKGLEDEIASSGFNMVERKGKKYNVTFSMPPAKFREAVVSLSQYFMLLNFSVAGINMKVKGTLPKPGKLVEKFATFKVDNKYAGPILENFLFDLDKSKYEKVKLIEVDQTFMIEGAEIPDEYKNDFALARLHAKKKGKIKRVITVDGNVEKEYEIDFCA